MNLLKGLTDFIGGGLFKEIKEGVMAYFPPDMNPQQKAEAALNIERMLLEKQKQAGQMILETASVLDKRISEQEGTAKDLMQLPYVGRLIIGLRGAQRPTWGYGILIMDYKWFFDDDLKLSETQDLALLLMNILVLGFLFGERTIKNWEPLILKLADKIFGNK